MPRQSSHAEVLAIYTRYFVAARRRERLAGLPLLPPVSLNIIGLTPFSAPGIGVDFKRRAFRPILRRCRQLGQRRARQHAHESRSRKDAKVARLCRYGMRTSSARGTACQPDGAYCFITKVADTHDSRAAHEAAAEIRYFAHIRNTRRAARPLKRHVYRCRAETF